MNQLVELFTVDGTHVRNFSKHVVYQERFVGNCRVLVELCYLFTNRSVMGIV